MCERERERVGAERRKLQSPDSKTRRRSLKPLLEVKPRGGAKTPVVFVGTKVLSPFQHMRSESEDRLFLHDNLTKDTGPYGNLILRTLTF